MLAMGKKVIAIDLNPLSRTARKATVSIVDNILRVVPNLTKQILMLSKVPRSDLDKVVQEYDNGRVLREAVQEIQSHLEAQFREIWTRHA
jgi:4-phosphopantoate--beta-alanine ligase